jgi:hypothetical protein
MESSKFLITLIFILLFYIVLLVLLNRAILYKGYKTFAIEEEEVKTKSPLLIAGNVSVSISLFILIQPFINFITYQINTEESMFYIFSVCSIVFIYNIVLFFTSFMLSKLISNFLLKVNSTLLLSVLWFVMSTLLIVLTSEFYNQITSTNAFNIY